MRCELVLGHRLAGEAIDLAPEAGLGRRHVLGRRPDVKHDAAGAPPRGIGGADRVREPLLVPEGPEEPARHPAAQHAVGDLEGDVVRRGDGRREVAEQDVGLLGRRRLVPRGGGRGGRAAAAPAAAGAPGTEPLEEPPDLGRAPRRRSRRRTRRGRAGRRRRPPPNRSTRFARVIRATVASSPLVGSPYPRGPKSARARAGGWRPGRADPRGRGSGPGARRAPARSRRRRDAARWPPRGAARGGAASGARDPRSAAPRTPGRPRSRGRRPASSAALATSRAVRARVPLRSTRPRSAVSPFSSGASSAAPPRDRRVAATTGAPRFSRTSTVRPFGRTRRVTGPRSGDGRTARLRAEPRLPRRRAGPG